MPTLTVDSPSRRQCLRVATSAALSTACTAAVVAAGLLHAPAWAQAPLKVGILYNTPISDVGWNFQHHTGMLEMEKALAGKVKLQYVENVPEGPDAERVIRQLAQDGNQVIFTPSFG
jgi:basic membrane protein A and related proteins